MPGPRGPRTRRASIAAHVAQGVMAAHAAEIVRAKSAVSRAGTRAGTPVSGQDPASPDPDGLMFQVFEPVAEVFIEAEPGETELACKHYMELMHMPRPSPPPSRQGIAQLFTGRSVRYEPIGKLPILLEPGKDSIQQLLTSLNNTCTPHTDLKVAKKLAKKPAKARRGSRTERKYPSTAVVEPTKPATEPAAAEEFKEIKLTTAQINRTAIRRRQAQHKARISLRCSNANAKRCSQSQRVISDICNDKSRLQWLGGAGVDFEKLCSAELSDSEDDTVYEGTELNNRCRYISIGAIPGMANTLLKPSALKAKGSRVMGVLKMRNEKAKAKVHTGSLNPVLHTGSPSPMLHTGSLNPMLHTGSLSPVLHTDSPSPMLHTDSRRQEDWATIDWNQYQDPEEQTQKSQILGAFGAKPPKLAFSSKLAKTPKLPSKDKLLARDKQAAKTTKSKVKLSLPALALPTSKRAAADYPLPMSARVTKKECSSALFSLLKRGKEDPTIFLTSELPAAMLHVKKRMNNYNKEIWGVREHVIDVEHRAGANWVSAVRRSFNNQRYKREVLNRAISKGINGYHISVDDIRSCAEVSALAGHLGCHSESSCYQAMQRRLKHMKKKEGVVPSFKTLKLFDTFEVLIEQESFLTVDVVLSMQEIIDVLLAVLRVPISFYAAWCQLHSISAGSRVRAQMKERHILYQRRKHKEALDLEKTPILSRQSSVVLQATCALRLGDRRVRRQSVTVLQAKNDLDNRRVRRKSVISMLPVGQEISDAGNEEPALIAAAGEEAAWVFGGQLTPHVQAPTTDSDPQQPFLTTQSPHPIELAVGSAAETATQASRSESFVESGPQSAPAAAPDSSALAAFMTECELEDELAAPVDRMRERLIQILARSDRSVEHTKLAKRLKSTTTHRPTKVLSAREMDLVHGAEAHIDIEVRRNGQTKVQNPDSIKKGDIVDSGAKTPRSRHNSMNTVSPGKASGGCAVANLLGAFGGAAVAPAAAATGV